MRIPAILTSSAFGVAFANLPDPDSLGSQVLPVDEVANPEQLGNLTDFRTLGDVVVEEEDYVAMGFCAEEDQSKCKEEEDEDGPGSRSFVRPPRIWDQYPKNGYFRVALTIDRNSFNPVRAGRRNCYELENFEKEFPKTVEDFKKKTGIELGYHKNDNFAGNPNKNDPEWDHAHWLHLTGASTQGLGGCSSYMGRKGNMKQRNKIGYGNGQQDVSLMCGCHFKNTITHEIIHALGWTHEQNRKDRDDFITINWKNIDSRMWRQFNKPNKADNGDTPYDPQSVMHYHEKSFGGGRITMVSKTNIPVITSKETYDRDGEFQARGLSEWDSYEINKQYDLRNHCKERGLMWQLWDYDAGKPKKGAEVVGNDGCIGSGRSKRQRTLVCSTSNPCRRNQECVDVVSAPYYVCKTNWIDPCKTRNGDCQNGATCKSVKGTGENPLPFTCICPEDTWGRFCEKKIGCVGDSEIMFDENMQVNRLCGTFTGYKDSKGVLDLSGSNNIRGLVNRVFKLKRFRNARNLKLHRSNIANIESDVFKLVPNVEKINLKMNKLTSLPENLFAENTKLKTLILSDNQLTGNIPKGILVPSLKNIYLQNNPDLVLDWSTLSRGLNNANELVIYNTKTWNPQYTHKFLCQHLTNLKKVKKCCYGTEADAFGAVRDLCM